MTDCIFRYTTEARGDGRRIATCVQCGRKTGWLSCPPENIKANCRVMPGDARVPLPGSELKNLLAEWGVSTEEGCGCEGKSHQMNVWGVDGCKQNRAEIVEWLQAAAAKKGWLASLAAAVASGSLVDEAIRRAESQTTESQDRTAQSPPSTPLPAPQ